MYTLENRVGRFCEIRIYGGLALGDIAPFRARLATVFQTVPGRVVICSDLRDGAGLVDEVVQALVAIARIDTPKVERHAMLVTPGQPVAAQLHATICAATDGKRKVLADAREAAGWLRECLLPEEANCLARFVAMRAHA